GLLASVIATDLSRAERIARQIEAGSVLINEVLYTHGLSETPWGGVKESGFGSVHSDHGFYEFVNMRHVHKPRWGFSRFRALWWFPYTQTKHRFFRELLAFLFKRCWVQRLKGGFCLITKLPRMLK